MTAEDPKDEPGDGGRPDEGDAALLAESRPSPPRPPLTASEGIKLVGGLVVVAAGLLVLVTIAIVAIAVLDEGSDVVAVATSAFGVIGTVVGAYFGLKIGTDGTQTAMDGLRDEAAKAQAFAAHVPEGAAAEAIAQAKTLAATPPKGPAGASGTRRSRRAK